MLDYSFHYASSVDRFIQTVNDNDLVYELEKDPIDAGMIISIEEPVAEDIWDLLDDLYDELEEGERQQLESESTDGQSTTALYIELQDGRSTIASVDPEVVNRILSVISIVELNDLIDHIAASVENPDSSPVCQRNK